MRCWFCAFLACWMLAAQAAPPVRDLTLAFDEFHTRTAPLPLAERVAVKATVRKLNASGTTRKPSAPGTSDM